MKDMPFPFEKGPGQAAGFFKLKPITHGIGQPQFFCKLPGFVQGFSRSSQDADVFLFEFRVLGLKISQLLTAERSPVGSIDQENAPARPKKSGQIRFLTVNQFDVKGRERISYIQGSGS